MKKLLLLIMLLSIACSGSRQVKISSSDELPKTKGNSIYYYLTANLQGYEGRDNNAQLFLDKALKKDPSATYLQLQRAYQLARSNQFEEARKLAIAAATKEANNPDAHILLGKIEISLGNNSDATSELKKAIQLDPKNEEAILLLSRQQATAGQTDDAIATLQKFAAQNPESTRIYYLLANMYATDKKNFDLALREYKNVLNYDPDDSKAWQLMAEIHLARTDYKNALEALLKFKESNPTDLNTQVRIALLYFELKERDKAIDAFKAILNDNPEADKIQYYLGLLHLDKEMYTQSIEYFSGIKAGSSFYDDAITREIAIYIKQNNKVKALELATSVLKQNPKKIEFYELLASVHAVMERYDLALETLKSGLKIAPKNEELLFSTAVLYEKADNWEKAIEIMKEVIGINPENSQALNFIGYTYAEKSTNLDEAQKMIEAALKLRPGDGYILDSLGWVAFQRGDLAKALELIKAANKAAPNEPTVLEHLGDVVAKMGNKKDARSFYEKAIFTLTAKKSKNPKDDEQIQKIRNKVSGL